MQNCSWREGHNAGELGVDWRIIRERLLKKYGVRM